MRTNFKEASARGRLYRKCRNFSLSGTAVIVSAIFREQGDVVYRVLIVDDDVELTELLREYIELEGFTVECVHDGLACLRSDVDVHDLIVLDVMLPSISGFEVLKRLRQRSKVPVIMLTARDGDVDRVVGLELGADDYVSKPVNPRELIARIRAVLRRTNPAKSGSSGELEVGDIRLDAASRSAWAIGRRLELTTAEFDLLQHLMRNAGIIVSRDELSSAVFGRKHAASADRNVDTLVSKVRRKIVPAGGVETCIKTIRNVGYLYALPSASTPDRDRRRAAVDD